jgi:hypothetical protein
MPYRLWQVRLVCENSACEGHQLTGAGIYKRARKVLDLDRYYYVVTENVECAKCHKRYIAWSEVVLRQLDPGHRSEFPIILTAK